MVKLTYDMKPDMVNACFYIEHLWEDSDVPDLSFFIIFRWEKRWIRFAERFKIMSEGFPVGDLF